jgi:hypothetical protein
MTPCSDQVLNHRGFYDEAYEMLMVLWKHLQSQLGDEHPKTLKALPCIPLQFSRHTVRILLWYPPSCVNLSCMLV